MPACETAQRSIAAQRFRARVNNMTDPCTAADAIVALDRKVSRAMTSGRGIGLTADQLDVLASIGLIELLAAAKAAVLKEQAQCRRLMAESINEARSGSTLSGDPGAGPHHRDSTFGGTTPRRDINDARARARTMFS